MTQKLFFRLVRIYKQTDFVRIVLWINVLFSAIVQFCRLPPHGGSGLKLIDRLEKLHELMVSLPTEGVD